MSNLTQTINMNNLKSVQAQITAKNGSRPYIATIGNVASILTDMDDFPYKRYFRGVYYYPQPIVFEREAGWRPRHDKCYDIVSPPIGPSAQAPYPNHCFESSCSTTYPCYPDFIKRYGDLEQIQVQLNRACIVQYR